MRDYDRMLRLINEAQSRLYEALGHATGMPPHIETHLAEAARLACMAGINVDAQRIADEAAQRGTASGDV